MAKSSFVPSYKKVADVIRERVLRGDYSMQPIASERQLASEFGVNYMTIRRGLGLLEEEHILVRLPNRRMRAKALRHGEKKHLNFAFLMPTLHSPALELWRNAIDRVTAGRPCSVRPILFMHWDDLILRDAMEGFDGIFLNPIGEKLPEVVAERLRHPHHPVVVVDNGFSAYGIPSIRIFAPIFIQRLLNHLGSLGHTHIGCFNTQPEDSEVRERIEQWRFWMAVHGFSGRLMNSPVLAGSSSLQHAYEVMNKVLAEPQEETAWFCITTPAAVGAMRAMLDRGLMPGRDIAVCAANGEDMASMLNPPLTALEASDPTLFVSYCLDWMSKAGQNWQGPLLMQPAEIPLVIRESTQPGAGRGLGPKNGG